MKQTLFMLAVMAVALPGALINPFMGLVVYYGFATLFPSFLWQYSLPTGVRWSLIVGLATLAGYTLHGLAQSAAATRWPLEKKLLLLLGVLIALSYTGAIDPMLARDQLDSYMKIFLMVFVACGLVDTRYRLHVLAATIVLTFGWLAVDFNQRYILMNQKNLFESGFANMDNNGVAAMMVMAMPFCIFLFSQEKQWFLKWPPLIAMLLMLHVVLFSMSRAAMLASLIMLPFMLLRLRRRWLGAGLTAAALAVGLFMAGPHVRHRFFTINEYEKDSSATRRLEAWNISVRVMRDYPVLGVGPNCFRRVSGIYDPSLEDRTMHNSFLQAAVDMGIPAGILNIAIPLLVFRHLGRLRRQNRGDPFVFNLAGSLQASLLGYALVGSFASIGTVELPYIVMVLAISLQNVVAVENPQLVAASLQKRRPMWQILGALRPATT